MGNPYEPPPPPTGPPRPPAPAAGRARKSSGGTGSGGTWPAMPAPTLAVKRRAYVQALVAALCTTGALLATAAQLPWLALAAPFGAAAIVFGILALRSARAAALQQSLVPAVSISLVVAVFYLASSVTVIATWSAQEARQECLANALTHTAYDACERAYQQALAAPVATNGL